MSYTPLGLKDAEAAPEPEPAKFGARGWLRWMWRQLTSMRVALLLLLLLAVVALPGAFFPQRPSDPAKVAAYLANNPGTGPWLDRFGLFDVYGSPWFSAVYILLFVSLIGCILPRVAVHVRAMRAEPARIPRRLTRFPVRASFVTSSSVADAEAAVVARIGRFHKLKVGDEPDGVRTVAAETGYGRESGNIVFHLALVGLLVVTAWGNLVHYRGQALVVTGGSFVNSPLDYDSFDSGALYRDSDLRPFRFTLEKFTSVFTDDLQARDFTADVTVTEPDGTSRADTIKVNHPLGVGGARVYLSGNGYAMDLTVRDADGEIAFTGAVPFLPRDATYESDGVVLVPDANKGAEQYGFSGTFLPTAIPSDDGAFVGSAFPEANNPVLVLQMWTGDLGLDEGVPKSLLRLDTTNLTQVMKPGKADPNTLVPYRAVLTPGQTVELPDGKGSVTLNAIPRFAALDLRYDPSIPWMGVFAGLAFVGLIGSLFLRRRRTWVRLVPQPDGTTMVHAAALARGDDPGLAQALDRVLADLDSKDES